jgi:hypothetical protein
VPLASILIPVICEDAARRIADTMILQPAEQMAE